MGLPVTTYKDNTSTEAPLNDYGIKVAKSGFDAITARDSDLLLNSSWPSLQMVKVVESTDTTPIPHDLPYPTLCISYSVNDTTKLYSGMSPLSSDSSYVYPTSAPAGSTMVNVIFNLDLTKDIDYPYTSKPQSFTNYTEDYGIKIAKRGSSIDSDDLRDYILHSRSGSPMVLAVKTEQTTSPENSNIIQYTSKLGYPSFVFGYVETTGGIYVPSPQGGQAYPVTFSNGTTSYLQLQTAGSYTGKATLIVLRSPMFSDNPIQVNYV